MIGRKRQVKTIGFLILLSISLLYPFIQNNSVIFSEENNTAETIHISAQRSVTKQWIKNPTFESLGFSQVKILLIIARLCAA